MKRAIEKGTRFLLDRYGVRRIRPDTLYNTWALGYALQAFGRLLDHEKDEAKRKEIRAAAQGAVRMLDKFEFVDGGWGYYNFEEKPARPGRGSASFTTATILIGMKWVEQHGVRIPKPMLRRSLESIRQCWRPDNSFYYGVEYIWFPVLDVNKVKGSLARTPVCLLALDLWSEYAPPKKRQVKEKDLVKALDDLEKYGHFLTIARKYPMPHETWYQNSGYFVLYGYYYASQLTELVPEPKRAEHRAKHRPPRASHAGEGWEHLGLPALQLPQGLRHGLRAAGTRQRAAWGQADPGQGREGRRGGREVVSDPEPIADVEDPRLAPYRMVRDPELVRRSARFLAEGRQVVRTLLRAPTWQVESVALTPTALDVMRGDLVLRAGVPVYLLEPDVFREIGGWSFHQGCLAVGRRPPAADLAALLARIADARRLVVLEALSNPDNVGAIFRTATALGADAVALSPTCASPLYRKALRTSMGSVLRLPFVHLEAWGQDVLAPLDALGFTRLALTPAGDAPRLDDVARALAADARIAIFLGAEGDGLSSAVLASVDRRVRIPMTGGIDSLNVAAAAAIAMYALRPG